MEITEVRIKLMEGSEDRLRAFCSITIDQSFVIRDLKIIEGSHGPFVAMPSRKLTGHCNRCGSKNHLRATFCNQCGAKLQLGGVADTPQKLYADVAHPINSECRELIQNAVVVEFNAELQRAAQPNYRSRYDDEFDAGDYDEADYSDSAPPTVTDAPPAVIDAAPVTDASASRPADPIPSGVRETVIRSSPASESPSRRQPDVTVAGSFGAGLFDAERPVLSAQAGADAPHIEEHAAGDEASQAIVVRGESGVQNSLPRPHFRDRPGDSSQSLVPSNAPSDAGRASHARSRASNDAAPRHQAAKHDEQDPADDSGFGAGIFDG